MSKIFAVRFLATLVVFGSLAMADEAIVGSWRFYNGDTRSFLPDGKCTGGNSGKGIGDGDATIATWSRDNPDRTPAKYTIKYRIDGYVDRVTLKESDQSLEGRSNHDEEVTARRVATGNDRGASTAGAVAAIAVPPPIEINPDQPPLEVLRQQGPNAIDWVLAPLDQAMPGDIRQNLIFVREELLDEAKQKPQLSPDPYALGAQFCSALLNVLEVRNQSLAQAGFRAAEAETRTGVANQALEARRNSQMSWPQYAREQDQRAELKSQAVKSAQVLKERPKLDWSGRTVGIRNTLDEQYRKYREALRSGKE